MKRWLATLVVIAGVLAGLVVTLFVGLKMAGMTGFFVVPANGMATFINKGDRVITEGLSVRSRLPDRGDVIVFTTEGISSAYMPPGPVFYIKQRVVGLPGDRLEFKGEVLHMNDRPVSTYFDTKDIHYLPLMSLADGKVLTVPAGHVFVMGDNSGNSSDSRYWGPLPVKNIRQKYWFHVYRAPRAEAEPVPVR